LTAYNGHTLFLVLLNQNLKRQAISLKLNPALVPFDVDRQYTVRDWRQNQEVSPTAMENGRIETSVVGKGITVLGIDSIKVVRDFQTRWLSRTSPISKHSFSEWESPLGIVKGMILSGGRSLTSAYVYLQATENDLASVGMSWNAGNNNGIMSDQTYPFEFSVPIPEDANTIKFDLKGVTPQGGTIRADTLQLNVR
jgi:hypothetical protein